jgi:hypothetical protein
MPNIVSILGTTAVTAATIAMGGVAVVAAQPSAPAETSTQTSGAPSIQQRLEAQEATTATLMAKIEQAQTDLAIAQASLAVRPLKPGTQINPGNGSTPPSTDTTTKASGSGKYEDDEDEEEDEEEGDDD